MGEFRRAPTRVLELLLRWTTYSTTISLFHGLYFTLTKYRQDRSSIALETDVSIMRTWKEVHSMKIQVKQIIVSILDL